MEVPNTQVLFFQHIKNSIPPHISFVDDIAEQLNISNDSAYRRIRGEKPITFEEIGKLTRHYKLSLDNFLHLESDSFIFNGRISNITNESDFSYEKWLESNLQHLLYMCQFPKRHIFILAKEMPFPYYFYVPEVSVFKSYFFKKTIIHYDAMRGVKFSLDDDHNNILKISKDITDTYSKIPSTEICHVENITSTLRQLEFYKLTGNFKSDNDALIILDKLEELLNHLEMQAESGKKFVYGGSPNNSATEATMYMNEIIWGDNMIHVDLGNDSITYINHSILNFITTRDKMFNSYMRKTIGILAGKSTQISSTNEKDRLIFFNKMRDKIKATRKNLF